MLDFERIEDQYLEYNEDEEIVAGHCAGCDGEIMAGEDILEYEGLMCHNDDCCIVDMLLSMGARFKPAEVE